MMPEAFPRPTQASSKMLSTLNISNDIALEIPDAHFDTPPYSKASHEEFNCCQVMLDVPSRTVRLRKVRQASKCTIHRHR
jgi:hypothetical protein